MRFNTIVPIVLALAGLVSAKLSVLSPTKSAVWGHNSKQTIKWTTLTDATDSTHVDLYLVCSHKFSTTVLSAIEKNIHLKSTDHIVYHVSDSLQMCDLYFVKFVMHNNCEVTRIIFSDGFYIGSHEALLQLGTCEAITKINGTKTISTSILTSTTTSTSEKTTQDHPNDDTPTQTQTIPDEPPTEPLPTDPTEPQKPVTTGDEPQNDTSTTTTSTSTSSPDKKPDNLDNDGSIITFKLFGILLSVISIFIFF